ncbi:MAG: hypothetical protein ACTII7_10900 [Galactobacter sp.]
MRRIQPLRALVGVVLVGTVVGVGAVACSSSPTAPSQTRGSGADAATPTPDASSAAVASSTPATSAAASSTAASSSAPTHADPTFATRPSKAVAAGQVSDAVTARAAGKGDTNVKYTVQGDLAAVVTVDCSTCTGPVTITGPQRVAAFGTVPKGGSGSYLMSPMKNQSATQEVWVQARGPWKLTVSSWNTVPRESGTVHGKGSRVFWVDGKHTSAVLEWKRSRPGDKVQARYFQADTNQPLMFGSDDPTYKERQEITTPGVMSIQTEGEWTFTPGR